MPNWCGNTLQVTGADDDLKKFAEATEYVADNDPENSPEERGPLSFARLVPLPTAEDGTLKYGSASDIWGTKWDVSDASLAKQAGVYTYDFQTAWAPPDAWLHKVAPMFPDLHFRLFFEESGENFSGVLEYDKGMLSRAVDYNGWLEGVLEERGFVEVGCDICSSDYVINDEWRCNWCEGCAESVCKHCKQDKTEHGEGIKCLYSPTSFEPIGYEAIPPYNSEKSEEGA